MNFDNSVLILVVFYIQKIQETLALENRRNTCGKTKLKDIWELNGDEKIQLELNSEGQPIGDIGETFNRWLGTFCNNPFLCLLMLAV